MISVIVNVKEMCMNEYSHRKLLNDSTKYEKI